jgi:predicted alpha/beta hydrolase family esterase
MKKRVFIVHCWDGTPSDNWYPWIKKQLEAQNFEVHVLEMPDTANPRIFQWVPTLAEAVGTANENTYFIGHSVGAQTIVRYIESLPNNTKVGGAVFVAGWFKSLTGIDAAGTETKNHWLSAPVNFETVHERMQKSIAIFSDNDPYVPLDNQDDFRDKLHSEIVIEYGQGHYDTGSKTTELPIALESLLKLAKND